MLDNLIVYFSIFLGKILHLLTLEEVKLYKKHLTLSKKILTIITSLILLFLSLNLFTFILIIPSFFLFKYLKTPYFVFGLGSFLSAFSNIPILPLSLMFILCLLHSSLEPFKKREFITSSIYFLLPFSLVFIENFINANSSIFTGILLGGLLSQVFSGK